MNTSYIISLCYNGNAKLIVRNFCLFEKQTLKRK